MMRRRARSKSSSLSRPKIDPVVIANRSNQAVLVVTLAPGTRSGDRVDRRGSPRSGHRARPIIFRPLHRLHAFRSLCSDGARGRGGKPRAFHQIGRGDRAGEGGNAVEQRAGPAVETNSPSLSPRGAENAVGGIRAWGEIRAAGPTHKRLYSHSGRLRQRTRNNVGLAAGRWRSSGSGNARLG